MSITNIRPGDGVIAIDGVDYPLRLTLGALAEIEDKIGQGSLDALRERLANPRISDLLTILQALLLGGGTVISLPVLKASEIDFQEVSGAIATAFEAFGGVQKKQKPARAMATKEDCPSPTGSGSRSAS